MCSIAVGTIGDMCRALNELILPYCDNIMNALLSTLQSNVLHRDVKPTILCLFGDIALAIGSKYQPYVNLSMSILDQASKTEFDLENNFDYCVALREGIVESYIGIVQGMKTGDAIGALSQFIPGIFMFLDSIVAQDGQSEAGIRAIMGLLGDLAEAFPNYELNQFFNVEWIDKMLTNVRSTRTEVSTRDVAKWLKEMLKRQRH